MQWSIAAWKLHYILHWLFTLKWCEKMRTEPAQRDLHPLLTPSAMLWALSLKHIPNGDLPPVQLNWQRCSQVSINFCWAAALKTERNHQNKLSLGFKAICSFSWLQQKWMWDYVFINIFCSKTLNLSKLASKLWPSSEVKDKDLICTGIKKKKKKKWKTTRKAAYSLQKHKYP